MGGDGESSSDDMEEVEVIEEVDGPGFVGHLVELLGTAG